ncbi:uncharacterized protein Gasu_24240 [Galdieria sulphuraria]|uniref:Uncharacterized protein n=1 Tax=Galdieria sulphuraria TaxID=130081 RepID=M2Y380_GALSU|nr:uncharacterized protein Gasu_24240 [Galdieria sulphuraria]EME30274.1 hypothetical protein Gasu_24240 [Galdieria sulphuraria]|eukprot:XP_005706794.1 hypothetical protein Gasu_24240 [Galdieria sulphuraria]
MRQTLYGAYLRVWPSSGVLAKFLVDRLSSLSPIIKDPTLLELGAGVGFCSIATSLITGYNIVATEGDTRVFTYLERNCQQIERTHPERLQWGDDHAIQELRQKYALKGFQYVFGADVVYQKESIPLLVYTIAHCLVARHGLVFLAFSLQFGQLEGQLLDCMEKYDFHLKERQLRDSVILITLERRGFQNIPLSCS